MPVYVHVFCFSKYIWDTELVFVALCSKSSVLQFADQYVVLIPISARTQPKAVSETQRTAEQQECQNI
jgi:hypothetical protein